MVSSGLFTALRHRFVAFCALAVLVLGSGKAIALEVAIISSYSEGSTQVVASALLAASTRHRLVHVGSADQRIDPAGLRSASLIIALGEQAAVAAAEATDSLPPLLVALVNAHEFERLRREVLPANVSALFIDQPIERHLRLMKAILPQAKCAGLVLGPQSRMAEPTFAPAMRSTGLAVEHSFAASAADVVPALERHLGRCAAALTLPDVVVSHPNVARAALLTSYRMQRPMFAYSRAWVEAGAVASVFSTPATATRDLLEWLDTLRDPRSLPPPAFARHFDLAVNARVARALGLQVPDENTLRAAIAAGRQP